MEILIDVGTVESLIEGEAAPDGEDEGWKTGFELFEVHQEAGCASVAIDEGVDFYELLFEVIDACFEDGLTFVAGDVFGDVGAGAFGVAHFSEDTAAG